MTITATVAPVAPGAGTPAGTVSFYDGGVTFLGTAVLSGGVARFTTAKLSTGDHAITACYTGNANFSAGTTPSAVTQTVTQDQTVVTLTPSIASPVYGRAVTFKATVAAAAPGAGTPHGTVLVYDGGIVVATLLLANGSATTAPIVLPAGSHPFTAGYSGDANFVPGTTSSTVWVGVKQEATKTTVKSSVTVPVFGQAVTLTATVATASPDSGTPGGSVTFTSGSTVLGTVPLDQHGVATIQTWASAVGVNPIVATYGGDANFVSSTWTGTQTVVQAATTANLTASSLTSNFGDPVTFTSAVLAVLPGSGVPTGTVTFTVDGVAMTPVALNPDGTATFVTSTLTRGTHKITVAYNGDANFKASPLSSLAETVN